MQKERDRLAGLNTAGFISGYRGSPLGGLDQQLFRSQKMLAKQDILFQPGLNEELAATACWGSQQAELTGEGRFDGVFSLWYGKGPGVDRTTDVFRHANLAGSSKHGGAIALMGDDHTAESSTVAHQTEFNFVDTMIPILNPAGVQELMDYGLYAYALSRFAGTWAALKCVKDNIESTASVDGSLDRVKIILPEDFAMPPGGLNIRHEIDFLAQEARLHEHKRAAAVAFVKANRLNQIVMSGGPNARLGIVSVGKSYLDVRQALDAIGIDEVEANRLGIRVFKVACPWPMVPEEIIEFARGLETIMIVEEKRSLLEVQVREELYGLAAQPRLIGKRDERGDWLFPVKGALDPNEIAVAIGERVLRYAPNDEMARKVSGLKQAQARLIETKDVGTRTPYFCSGCPHNTSTRVPEGSRASAGIGCHYMALWMDRDTVGFTAMGGEGANWVGEAPFSKRKHIFQNLGDGTYNHSGVLALRFALAAKTNVTYKILFNDAVAMTGGQRHEGGLTVDMIANQVRAEGVERIAVVTDEPEKYGDAGISFPPGVTVHHRSELDAVQRDLRDIDGVTVVIYDQTCAAEKRRRRKRGQFPDPDKRVIINELVCEGCGDCSVKSNCVSVQPLETEFGRKRRIDQSSCNKDFSCVEGFCPSFVTVHGAKIKKAEGVARSVDAVAQLPPEPALPSVEQEPWACIVTGVGGTGVVTIGAIIGMAAHLEGKGCGMIDMAGLAQKGGSVYSHIKVARSPDAINAIRVSAGEASLILGGDLVVSGTKKALAAVRQGKTLVVANTAEVFGGEFTRNADFSLPAERLKRAIVAAAGRDRVAFVDATGLAAALFGNTIAANMFLLGFAQQKGGVPLSAALERAIELNGEAVPMNIEAFRWGRRTAHDQAKVEALVAASRKAPADRVLSTSLQEIVDRRAAFLTDYQDAAYAHRYRTAVARIQKAEMERAPGRGELAEAVARYLFKLMAYKDEYEVARLYTDGNFQRQLAAEFEPGARLEFHLAPPLLGRKDAQGNPAKTTFGPWMLKAFALLAPLKRLRGTAFDPFGYTEERRTERRLIGEYEGLIDYVAARLSPENHATAVALASIPEKIRGYGHVKARHLKSALAERDALKAQFDAPAPRPLAVAAE
jgi:indolepyruvate ferredoxin oxidoreductase